MSYYPMTQEVSEKLIEANLTAAEWRFWVYLATLDPWGDRYISIDPLAVMAKCKLSKPTYYRAKAKFQELGLFDFQEEGVSFRNLAGVSKAKPQSQEPNPSLKNETPSLKNETPSLKNETPSLKNETGISKMRLESQKRDCEAPEPLQNKAPETPHTIQTYQIFKDSLSEEERESFENFCKREVAGFPRPIVNLCDYLAAEDGSGQPRYLEFWLRFGRTNAAAELRSKKAIAALTPELYDQWDKEFRAMGCDYVEFVEDTPPRTPERELKMKFFDEWDKRNLDAVPVLY